MNFWRLAAFRAVMLGATGDCGTWSATGHEWESGIAIEKVAGQRA